MEQNLNQFLDWMGAIAPVWAYLVILGIAYGENVLPPIPGDLIVVFGGYLAGIGQLSFVVVVVLATLGGALGFMTMYALGRRIGDAIFEEGRLRWLPKREVFKVRHWLERWGYGVVAANRFLSGARSVISLTVGMAHTHAWKTAAFATFSAAVWTALITYAGYALGDNWTQVVDFLRDYGRIVLIMTGVVLVAVLVRYLLRRNKQPGAEVPEASEEG